MAEVWGDRQAEGSSPRVRGKPRISLSPSSSPGSSRACRENGGDPKKTNTSDGSSPRVRGKPPRHPVGGAHPRLIPARAGKTWSRTASGRTPRAHPRACGENVTLPVSIVVYGGSSPRVRGKPHQQRHPLTRARLIPARAGKTRGCSRAGTPRPAHPRACGGNAGTHQGTGWARGSSPRVRGKQRGVGALRGPRGLIPARAGKTGTVKGARTVNEAHPRACGENGLSLGLGFRGSGSSPRVRENRSAVHDPPAVPGSSPRVRGKRPGPQAVGVGPRLIPACAGKTRSASAAARAARAHPRVCGENDMTRRHARVCDGSSPRVRGKRDHEPRRVRKSGLIPACAGKTRRPGRSPSSWGAHPRVCGENPVPAGEVSGDDGSSPRVRGKPHESACHPETQRLIPACAGKTGSPSGRPGARSAHPRVCGENAPAGGESPGDAGSSPRVRGKLQGGPVPGHAGGLIPACAGKTTPTTPSPSPAPAHPRVCGENRQ